jgi:hypothetical protein
MPFRAALLIAFPARGAVGDDHHRTRTGERPNGLVRRTVYLLQQPFYNLQRGHLHVRLLEVEQA